jgi:nucleoside-diphosphate-sugar epimerase
MKGKKLLIVGGTGFIGRNVAREAVNRGFQVSSISRNSCPSEKKLKGVKYIVVDVIDKVKLSRALNDKTFHYVINLCGYVNHENYFDGGDKVFKVHFDGTMNLVSCIDKSYLKSFVQIGSSDEYGDNVAPQNESQRESPISPYSFAKVASTHFLQMLYKTESFPAVVLRPFLVYGPGQDNNRFIPQIIQGCINDGEFSVSDGGQLRDFCYIDDIVDVILLVLTNKRAHGEVMNIASGVPASIKDVVLLIKSLVDSGKPQFGLVPYRDGENMTLYADISKIQNILKWSPKYRFLDGINKTISYYDSR